MYIIQLKTIKKDAGRRHFFNFFLKHKRLVERTQTGKMVARQNPNFKDGRPKKYTPIQIEHALSLLSSGKSYKEVEEITGISKSTMIRAKNKEGAV